MVFAWYFISLTLNIEAFILDLTEILRFPCVADFAKNTLSEIG
jgi:hypothetical protein